MSPSARSKKHLEDRGFIVGSVEKYNQYSRTRHDFPYKKDGGFADLLAYKPGVSGVLAVQCTTSDNVSSREKKIQGYETLYGWTQSNNACVIHGWSKKGPKGKRKLWAVRILIYAPESREFLTILEHQMIYLKTPLLLQAST